VSIVATEGLSVAFGQPVLRDVTLQVNEGDFVALMGSNGTGKTTLVRTILGLQRPQSGASWLFGVPTTRFRDWHRVAYVPQRLTNTSAVPLSVEEAVRAALASPAHRWRPLSRAQRLAIDEALAMVGLQGRGKERLEHLSGGQQRRVMIARALATDAELLIMDEPTAGVDLGEQRRIAGHMRLLRDRNVTVLLITHDVGPVAGLSNRAIVLGHPDHGSVRYDGASPPPPQYSEHVWHHSHEGPSDPGLLEGP
jgi:zinc transport system ATP-binding protein